MASRELELEVTEGIVQTEMQNLSILQSLKALGTQLAIDDFGTGYSSFASLKHFRVDCLKIDKYFIDDMVLDEETPLIIGSMIEMGHKLGYQTIAEGIETPRQLEMIRKFGCKTVQGYLFSKPVSADGIEKLLNASFAV